YQGESFEVETGINPLLLRLPSPITSIVSTSPREAPIRKQKGRFLKGPIPLDWLSVAGKLPGRALHVAIAIWFGAGLTRSRQVALSRTWLRHLGVNRYAAYRGLNALESAGLVSVVRHRGRKPMVTILDAQALESASPIGVTPN